MLRERRSLPLGTFGAAAIAGDGRAWKAGLAVYRARKTPHGVGSRQRGHRAGGLAGPLPGLGTPQTSTLRYRDGCFFTERMAGRLG